MSGASKGLAIAKAGANKASELAKTAATEAEKRLAEEQQRRAKSNGDSGNEWRGLEDRLRDPEAAQIAFKRGQMHGKSGQTTGDRAEFARAREAFEEALAFDPDHTEAYRYLAMTCKMLGDSAGYERHMAEYNRRKQGIMQ